MTSKLLYFIVISLMSASANANICGTDFQNFNPTTNGLDFVTVHSSETLRPCVINMGVFFNYAANSLTYSKTLNTGYRQKAKDRILGMDLSLGFGLTDRWDVGINVPFILSQEVQDDYYVASYGNKGATEIKINTKYRLLGDESGGLAGIVSLNQNLITDNPFIGRGAGPTWNFELAADTTIAEKWAVAVNAGYRKRDPGTPIAGVPFTPMKDQWIYSTAASYLFAEYDTKLIFEIYGSRAAQKVANVDTDRDLNALEGLIGVKFDATENMALHFGGGQQIDASLGGPDWRLYAGMNWALGPVCKTAVVENVAPVDSANSEPQVEEFKIDVELLFALNSDSIDPARIEELHTSLAQAFKQPFLKLTVEGHTDTLGSEAYNIALSQRRAKNLADLLIKKYELDSSKVDAVGLGPSRPIADNGNYQGRRKNRRVELKFSRAK